jgi:hypothetical protein
MNKHEWEIADRIALDLFKHETDSNEVHKAFQYARVQLSLHPDQTGKRFFQFLRIMVRDGRYFVRSSRTLFYYLDLESSCKKHLKEYEDAKYTSGQELVEILAWVVRLMKYYGSQDVPKSELINRDRGEHSHEANTDLPNPEPLKEKPILAKKAEAEREKIKREKVTLATEPAGGKARIITQGGEEVPCTGFSPYATPNKNEMFHADVTRRGEKAIRAVFKGLLRKHS